MNNHTLISRVVAVALLASLAAGCGRTAVTPNSNSGVQTGAADSTPATATPAQNAASATPAAQDTTATPPALTPAAKSGGGAAVNPAATASPVQTPNRPATARTADAPKPQIGSGGNDFYAFTQARAALAADDELKSSSVVIEISGGVATLTGAVAADSQKQKAERLVKGVRGVTGVKNQIRVAAGAPK